MFFPMSMIRQVVYGAVGAGANLQQLLHATALTEERLVTPEQKIDWQEGIKIWQAALDQTADEHLGLHIGENTTTAMAGLAGHLMERSKDLYSAALALKEYQKLANEMFIFSVLLQENDFILHIQPIDTWKINSPHTAQHAVDLSMASVIHIAKLLTGKNIYPNKVELTRCSPQNSSEYERCFQVTPAYKQAQDRLIFKKADAFIPIISHNESLLNVLKKLASDQLRVQQTEPSTEELVRKWIQENAYYQIPQLEEAAKALHITARTLQRKLKSEGSSFYKLVEEVHKQTANSLLKNTDLAINEIAELLGYTEPNAFRRAYKRWTGTTPKRTKES